jgi:polyferredoxin
MDACDHMMENVGLEKGLIRYDSEEGIKTSKKWKLTTRAKAYVVLMLAIISLLVVLLVSRSEIEFSVLRVRGTTYQKVDDSTYVNIFKTNISNKSNVDHDITMTVISENATVEVVGGPFVLKKGEQLERELIVRMVLSEIDGPKTPFVIGLFSNDEMIEEEEVYFNGPGF